MARMRTIKPGFFLNEELADHSPWGRLLFAGLWCLADREGRLEDRPRKIKAEIFPYDNVNVDEFLSALQVSGFILRYSVDGHDYIQVVNFTKHQSPHSREVPSIIPAPTQAVPKHDLGSDKASPRIPLTLTLTDTVTLTERENAAERANGVAHRPQKAATCSPRALPEKKKPPEPGPREPRPRNALWDALEAGLNYHPKVKAECSNMGKVVRELQEAGATPEEIPLRIARYVTRYGRERLTLNALHNHWSECATDPVISTGGGLDAKAREVLASEREATKRRLYEEAMRLADGETRVDDHLQSPKAPGG